MRRDRIATAQMWLASAHTDLELAQAIVVRFPTRACFHAQQSAELALKAALIALADDHPRTHVGDQLVRELEALGETVPDDVARATARLDLFYVSSRYPDALGGADPLRVIGESDARDAVARAVRVVSYATELVSKIADS
jgi:HEPN domain-containing protein